MTPVEAIPLEQTPAWLLWRVANRWQALRRAVLAPMGLSNAQYLLLEGLDRIGGSDGAVTQAALARFCQVDVTHASQVLRGLACQRLIARRRSADERVRTPELTLAGRQLLADARPAAAAVDAEFFRSLGPEANRFVMAMQALAGMKLRVPASRG